MINFTSVVKFLCRGHIRSGHQVESSDLTSKKVYARATATVLNRIFSSFQNLIRPLVPTTFISRIFIYPWPGVRSSSWPLHYKPMGEYWNPSQRISKAQIFQNHVLLGHSWWPKVKCWSVTTLKSSEVTRGHQQFFADNLRLRRARDMKVVSMCLSRQYASTDMQLGSRRDLDLRSNFELDSSRSCYTCFEAYWQGEHDGVKIIALSFQTHTLSSKNCFAQKCRFWPFVTSDA